MKTEIEYDLENIADFLTNSFGNCSLAEMVEFLAEEFKLSPTQAKNVVEKYQSNKELPSNEYAMMLLVSLMKIDLSLFSKILNSIGFIL